MSGRSSGAVPSRKQSSMRPPARQTSTTGTAQRSGASSPADSLISSVASPRRRTTTAGIKRKARDYDGDGGEETNIHVVVRCRGRNEREVRENSGVVVSTDAVRGSNVELSMGPSALSNKTYHFDKVFSPAADQTMIFDDVVAPVLDEMLQGFNCTIFAYGQTGTGKTYTMSGDMSDTAGLVSDAAGIIPRVLHALFQKLQVEENETSVKCSFIELYNEELRDLLSLDDTTKLKIYEDTQKKGQTSTLVQGMEEAYIKSAKDGIALLQNGSHKRQVAATKCNDLSSRSHSVFTVTAYMKNTTESGEDIVCAGKLNLVDLAGSENIQRSGAENKRAAEAGLINKSLLTLGRVINSLVERSSHIPYRESKLTRLLQDSLGGRTKTCIIATISPAKSNLEETISTLDYAFRAKNIKNKPQINQMISKKTMLREFTSEIEKLKLELQATRQRNGVYLTAEGYEEITGTSESRRILSEEQAQKIETIEATLRSKVEELFSLTSIFNAYKKESEQTRLTLNDTKTLLQQTDEVLAQTKASLEEETLVRKAHQATETRLHAIGNELLATLTTTKRDIGGLHAKIDRQQKVSQSNAASSEATHHNVDRITHHVQGRLQDFQTQQTSLVDEFAVRLQSSVEAQLQAIDEEQKTLDGRKQDLDLISQSIDTQGAEATLAMNAVLEEIKVLREDVRKQVGLGLQGLSAAAARISGDVIHELGTFQTELQSSYTSLGQDFTALFDHLAQDLETHRQEGMKLRSDMSAAAVATAKAQQVMTIQLETCFQEQKAQADAERAELQSQICHLMAQSAQRQEERWRSSISAVEGNLQQSQENIKTAESGFTSGMALWSAKEQDLVHEMEQSRDKFDMRMRKDCDSAQTRSQTIQNTTKAVHEETVRIVDEQMNDMARQMQVLDEFVNKARRQNEAAQHDQRQRFSEFSTLVHQAHDQQHRNATKGGHSLRDLDAAIIAHTGQLRQRLPLVQEAGQPLVELREGLVPLEEYVSTGSTPPRIVYRHPEMLPRTEVESPSRKPEKPEIYVDEEASPTSQGSEPTRLREVSPNMGAVIGRVAESMGPPPLKRQASKIAVQRNTVRLEGRENAGTGRRLRSSLGR